MPEVITREIDGNWLTNGHLEICLLKLASPTEDEWKSDGSRVGNIEIITQLLKSLDESEECLLEREFSDKPSLVLAPELAFGSPDFDSIDALIKQYNKNLIFICGFGFTTGDTLTNLATRNDVEGIWRTPPKANNKYNGGWIWVKHGDVSQCYIFLKNCLGKNVEVTIPNIEEGDCILRLEGNDLVIFPVICADLISTENNSPRKRISESLKATSSSNKRVLVTGSLLNEKSESKYWMTAIGDLLDAVKSSNARLLLSNCINPKPVQDENVDRWRCLSGAYQYLAGGKPPKCSLPCVRYVEDTKFIGFVLRNPETGVAFGKLQWTNDSAEGLHALERFTQYIWKTNQFHFCDGSVAADELYRFVLRNKGEIFHSNILSSDAAKELSNTVLGTLLEELSPASNSPLRFVADELFQKCLTGIKKDTQFNPDKLHSRAGSLDSAITTLKLLQYSIGAKLMPKGKELDYGQLLSADDVHEILVWDSSDYTAKKLCKMVEESIVIEAGSARILTIIGRGNGGGMPPKDGRIKRKRLADISNAPPMDLNTEASSEDDFEWSEHRDRVVFWKNQGEIDEVLISDDHNQDLVERLRREINVPEDL